MVFLGTVVGALVVGVAPVASAQTLPYPPGPCQILSGTQFAGNVSVGQTFTIVFTPACAFDDGTSVVVVVNGMNVGVRVAVAGTASITVTVVSVDTLSINPLVPAVCGVNVATATGFSSAARANVTQTATFNLVCPGTPVPPGPPPPQPPDVIKVPVRVVSVPVKVAQKALAFTGANFLQIVAFALLLMSAGSTFVVASRQGGRLRT